MAPTARVASLGVAIFAVLAAAYVWASPSLARQGWDSLNYAWACEMRGPRPLWGNHPLGHLVGCGTFEIARRLGYEGRALPVMKAVNGVFAAAAASALLALLTRALGVPLLRSVGWTVVFGVTIGWWRQAGSADYYSLAVLLLIVAWGATIRTFERPSTAGGLVAGLAFGAATVAHQFAGVVLAVAVLGLLPLRPRRGRARVLATLAITATATIVVGYVACGVLALGSTSALGIARWMIGYGADPLYGRFLDLHGAGIALGAVVATLVPGDQRLPIPVVVAAAVTVWVGGAVAARRLPHRERSIALACALQWLSGAVLITWWDPRQVGKFWLITLPALVVWCDLALRGLAPGRAWEGCRRVVDALPALAGAAMVLDTGSTMVKERQPDLTIEAALRTWVEHSRPDDMLIVSDGLTRYLRYWEHRSGATDVYNVLRRRPGASDRFTAAREVIAAAAREGRAVLYAPEPARDFPEVYLAFAGLTSEQVQDFFDRYPREGPVFEYRRIEGEIPRPVYRLVVPTQ